MISRRRALQAGGAAGALLGLGLIGCGGDEESSSTGSSGSSGPLKQPKDTTSSAKPGGTFKSFAASEGPNFDMIAGGGAGATLAIAHYGYQRLTRFTLAKYPDTASGEVEGDFAESWEYSPDKLTVTMKLRKGNKWDPRPPTNGRVTDAQDVAYTWNRLISLGNYKNDVYYDATLAPDAPVESMTVIDPQTISFKLRKPSANFLASIAQYRTSFWLMPREADGGFDVRNDIRGTGPWMLEKFTPSLGTTWMKNPNYFLTGQPYFDRYELPTIGEHATQLAQFRAGNIWTNVARSDEILELWRDLPQTDVHQASDFSNLTGVNFGYAGNSQFKDKRVRQAVSLAFDRETMLHSLENFDQFEQVGIDVSHRFHTTIAASYDASWLDPTDSKKFGSNAKYYTHDIAEAKKLLSAAGYSSGFDTTLFASDIQTAAYVQWSQIIPGALSEVGIRAQIKLVPDGVDYIPVYHYAYTGNYWGAKEMPGFNGLLLRKSDIQYPTADQAAYVFYHKNGASFTGASPDGNNPHLGDPKINSLVEQIRTEFDLNKQRDLLHEFQRVQADAAYRLPFPGYSTKALTVVWPVISNYNVHRGPPGYPIPGLATYFWQDSTKAPLGTN
jgi:peptide/nickel transport system substrate-binding protein